MIIEDSTLAMGSRRSYSRTTAWQGTTALMYRPRQPGNSAQNQKNETADNTGKRNGSTLSISKEAQRLSEQLRELRREDEEKRPEAEKQSRNQTQGVKSADEQLLETLRQLLEELKQMRQKGGYGYNFRYHQFRSDSIRADYNAGSAVTMTGSGGFSLGIKGQGANVGQIQSQSGAARQNGVWIQQRIISSFTHEEETTAFSSMGMVKTADGREINFNIDVEMSRSFTVQSSLFSQQNVIYTDPLVINLDGRTAQVSDQKFYFDLDADGEKEEMSSLGSGSGFLALDKNADGMINDGSELFGAKSGDGFADLAAYDEDGNGWIDEQDDIFDKLKIWVKNEDGSDRLLSLKEAGVGAMYLGKASTQFSVNDMRTNENQAVIRSTGVYLKENGEAGTMQHVDFAV